MRTLVIACGALARELRAIIEQAVIRCQGDWITAEHLGGVQTKRQVDQPESSELVIRLPGSSLREIEIAALKLALKISGGRVERAVMDYDPNGSLVTTHKSQGTDMGLYGGFLGWDADEPLGHVTLGTFPASVLAVERALRPELVDESGFLVYPPPKLRRVGDEEEED